MNFERANQSFLKIFSLFLMTYLIVYAPVILNCYAHHDDYMFLMRTASGQHIQHEMLWATGRIAGDWVVYVQQKLIHNFPDFILMPYPSGI